MTIEFTDRVRRGIAALEKYEPGSTDRINLDTLDLYSDRRCALAQAIGGGYFQTGRDKLGLPPIDDTTAEYGFSLTTEESSVTWDEHGERYAALRDAWVAELTAHRSAKATV